jgi:3-oxoacyl-[acyl-carrier protein] reductase
VVLVTGGGHGIGRAYCERFAAEGAAVVAADLDQGAAERVAASIQAAGQPALGVGVDVARAASVSALIERTLATFGRLDGLVNNAAIFATIPISRVGFEAIPEAEWDRLMQVNVKGVWLCCRAAAPALRRAGGGSVVNISSDTVMSGIPIGAHYVASKAALIGLTRVLARELGGDNIRVNAIAPGSTLSEEDPTPEIVRLREAAVATRALKRVQTPGDILGSAVFLLSDDAAFVTGQTLVVNGGGVLH